MIGNRLIKNTGFVFVSGITNKLFSFFFIAYAARVLGPGDFGVYALIGTVTFLFSYFGNLGIMPMAVREISRDKNKAKELFDHVLSFRMVFIVLSYPILVLVVNLLGYGDNIKKLIYLAGLSTICSTFSGSFRILYVAFERFKVPSLISIVVSFFSSIANILFLYLGYGLSGIIWISFFGSLLGAVISGLWVRWMFIQYRFSFKPALWKDLLSQAMPFAIIMFFQQAYTYLNTILLSKLPGPFPGDIAMGYYNSPASVSRMAMTVPESFRQAALPAVTSNADNLKLIKGIIDKSTKFLIVIVIFPLILATTFFPREIITLIFGKGYLPSVPALTILGWAYALQVFNAPVSVTLSSSKEIKRFIPWIALVLGVNVLFAVPLIIYYSFVGAAIAFLISKAFETVLRHRLLRSIWNIKRFETLEFMKMLFPMIIVFLVILMAYLCAVNSFRLLILTLILYTLWIFSMKGFRQRLWRGKLGHQLW